MFNWPWPQSVLDGPAMVSPDGTYNFDIVPPHNNKAYALVGISVVLTIVGAMMRGYSRIWVTKKVHIEDYIALFSLIPYFTFIWAFIMYIQGGGLYVHQWNIRAGNMLDLAVYLFAFSVMDPVYCMAAKTAILLEWKRIFVPLGIRNWFYWAAWSIITYNLLFYFIATFFMVYANRPVAKSWNVLLPGDSPFSRQIIDVVAAAVNLSVDLGVLLIPQRVIWSLAMSRSRKIGLGLMFSLGLLSIGFASVRLWATEQAEYPWPEVGHTDTSYTISPLWLWYLAEMTAVNLVMVAPCIPRFFSEHSFLGRLMATFRTWTGSFSSKSSTAVSKSKSWPRTIGASSGRLHRLADDEGQIMGLADLKYMRTSGYTKSTSTDHLHPNSITKTIVVDQEEESASKASLDPTQQRQHPWRDE